MPNWILESSQFLIIISGILSLALGIYTIKRKWLMKSLIIFSGIFSILGAWLDHESDNVSSAKMQNAINENKSLTSDNNKLAKENNKLSGYNNQLINKNIQATDLANKSIEQNISLSKSIRKSANDINGFLNSEDSYCYIMFTKDGDYASIIYQMQGKYPIQLSTVRIVDIRDSGDINKLIFGSEPYQSIINTCYPLPITLYPNQSHYSLKKINRFYLNKAEGLFLNVFFSTNRGEISQQIEMKYANGWKSHTILHDENKLISETWDKGFPK